MGSWSLKLLLLFLSQPLGSGLTAGRQGRVQSVELCLGQAGSSEGWGQSQKAHRMGKLD